MAAYVLDASVVISRLVRDNYTSNAIVLFQQMKISDEFHIPEFCRLECVNVLWKHVRFQGLPASQAEKSINDLLALPLKVVPIQGLFTDTLRIGLAHQLAIYDSVYIALARYLHISLISIDQRQISAALQEKVTLKPITDFIPG
jgi:predicted nucleic acid-binding protein